MLNTKAKALPFDFGRCPSLRVTVPKNSPSRVSEELIEAERTAEDGCTTPSRGHKRGRAGRLVARIRCCILCQWSVYSRLISNHVCPFSHRAAAPLAPPSAPGLRARCGQECGRNAGKGGAGSAGYPLY